MIVRNCHWWVGCQYQEGRWGIVGFPFRPDARHRMPDLFPLSTHALIVFRWHCELLKEKWNTDLHRCDSSIGEYVASYLSPSLAARTHPIHCPVSVDLQREWIWLAPSFALLQFYVRKEGNRSRARGWPSTAQLL